MRFVFVHGGFHAAWCWDRTVAELARRGHDAVAVDLPGHGGRVDDPLSAWTIPARQGRRSRGAGARRRPGRPLRRRV